MIFYFHAFQNNVEKCGNRKFVDFYISIEFVRKILGHNTGGIGLRSRIAQQHKKGEQYGKYHHQRIN